LAALQKEFAGEDVVVITICQGASAEEVREALKETGVEGVRTLVDEDQETMMPYHASATPTTYLIDREGVIQMSDVGYGSGSEAHLRREIKRLLEE
jgi:cytochrome oxidase Cu insertion factor (SCO1/SenC/PrrC family)